MFTKERHREGLRAIAVTLAFVMLIWAVMPGFNAPTVYAADLQAVDQMQDPPGGAPGEEGQPGPEDQIDEGDGLPGDGGNDGDGEIEEPGEPGDSGDSEGGDEGDGSEEIDGNGEPVEPGDDEEADELDETDETIDSEEAEEDIDEDLLASLAESEIELENGLFASFDTSAVKESPYWDDELTITIPVTIYGNATQTGIYSFIVRVEYDYYIISSEQSLLFNVGAVNQTILVSINGVTAPYDISLLNKDFVKAVFTGAKSFSLGNGMTGKIDTANFSSNRCYQYGSNYYDCDFNIPIKITGKATQTGLCTGWFGAPLNSSFKFGVLSGSVNNSIYARGWIGGNYDDQSNTVTFNLSGFTKPDYTRMFTNVKSVYYDDKPVTVNGVKVSLQPAYFYAGKVLNATGLSARVFVPSEYWQYASTNGTLGWQFEGTTAEAGMWRRQLKENGSLLASSLGGSYAEAGDSNAYSGGPATIVAPLTANALYTPVVSFIPFTADITGSGKNFDIGNGVSASMGVNFGWGESSLEMMVNLGFSGDAVSDAIHEPKVSYVGPADNISKDPQQLTFSVVPGPMSISSYTYAHIPLLSIEDMTIDVSDFLITDDFSTDVYRIKNDTDQKGLVQNGVDLSLRFENEPFLFHPVNGRNYYGDIFSNTDMSIGIVRADPAPTVTLGLWVVSGTATKAGAISWNLLTNGEPVEGAAHSVNIPKDNYKMLDVLLDQYTILVDKDMTLSLSGSFSKTKAKVDVPQIIEQPQPVVTVFREDVEFSVSATSSAKPLKYRWQVNTGSKWADVSSMKTFQYEGASTAVLTLKNVSYSLSGYRFRCIVSNDGGSATSNAASLTIMTYLASATPSGMAFVNAEVGYGAIPAQLFTVKNTGTEGLDGLDAVLDGGVTSDFEITSGLSESTLSPGQVATVSVMPKAGLEPGSYKDILRITGNDGINLSVPLSFTVNEPSFLAAVSPSNNDFGEAEEGYSAPPLQVFTVTNNGTGALSGLAAVLGKGAGSDFEITSGFPMAPLMPNQSADVSVSPKPGLEAGEADLPYTDTLEITCDNGVSLSVPLTFTVRPEVKYRGIVKGADNLRFIDRTSDFFGSIFRGTNKELIYGYGDYYEALLKAGNTPAWRACVIDFLEDENTKTWGGADFGMAAVVALMKAGELSPGFFQSGASKPYDLKAPKESGAVAALITYYNLMQLTPGTRNAIDHSPYEEENCAQIVDALLSSAWPVLIGFDLPPPDSGSHVILGYDIGFNEAASRYEISVWDPYSAESPSDMLYITKDTGSGVLGNGGFKNGAAGGFQYNPAFLKFALTVEGKEANYDALNIQKYLDPGSGTLFPLTAFGSIAPASLTDETAIMTNYGDFTITASGGYAVVAGGTVVSGSLAVGDGKTMFEDSETGVKYLRFSVPTLTGSETYTLEPDGSYGDPGDFETSVFYDSESDGFYSRILTGAVGGYVFGADGLVSVDWGGGAHEATLKITRNGTEYDLYTTAVTATDTGFSLAPSAVPGTIAVAEFDGSGLAKVEVSGDYNSLTFEDVQTASGFSVMEIDGKIVLVAGGSDLDEGVIGYSVVFISKGGTSYEALANIASGTAIESPGTPVKAGHAFGGWYLDAAYAEACSFPLQITANTKIYAKWTANKYAVTYNANGGKFTSGIITGEKSFKRVEAYGSEYAGSLTIPERAGYVFLGWNTSKDVKKGNWAYKAGERAKAFKVTAQKNHTVYAIWQAIDGAIFLNDNYGGAQDVYLKHVPRGKTYKYNGKLKAPASRPGFTFGGWYKKNAAGALKTKVTDKTKMTGSDPVTLYAKWTAKKVSVTMNLNQNSVKPAQKNTTKKASVSYGSSYAGLAIPALAGVRFVKWTKDPAGTIDVDAAVEPAANSKGAFAVTVYAQYEYLPGGKNEYLVKLNPNGGTVNAASIMAEYQKSPQLKYSELAGYDKGAADAPVRTGYTFAGWYTAAKGGSKVTAATKVKKYVDHTLYARWTANKYWVAFDLDGGKAGGKGSVAHKRYTYGAKYKSLPAPKKAGYTFLGWYMDPGDPGSKVTKAGIVADYAGWQVSGSDSSSTKASKASPTVTLTAMYAPGAYKATFSANGGNFGVSAVKSMRLSETYGDAYVLPPQPVRAGYVFNGWYTKKSGGTLIDEGNVELTKKATLYAQWVRA